MPIYTNNDGLEVRFGNDQGKRSSRAGVTTGAGKRREFVLTVDLAALGAGGTGFTSDLNNDGVNEAFNPSNTPIPVGWRIVNVTQVILVTPVGGTSYALGTYQEAGTVVNATGLLLDAGTAGGQVGTAVLAASGPWYIAPRTVGTYTAGRVLFVVEAISV